MSKYARIIDNVAIDVVASLEEVQSKFHASLVAEFVEVPDEVDTYSWLDDTLNWHQADEANIITLERDYDLFPAEMDIIEPVPEAAEE